METIEEIKTEYNDAHSHLSNETWEHWFYIYTSYLSTKEIIDRINNSNYKVWAISLAKYVLHDRLTDDDFIEDRMVIILAIGDL